MRALLAWLEDRTGLGGLLRGFFWEPLPGGPKWKYTWYTLILGAFLIQAGSGFFLWAYYSPSTTTAWASVYHVQTAIEGGWFLRGLHHFGAQAVVVLLGLHIFQLITTRACRVPGEIAFWITLLLLPVAVGFSVTGWLLPMDQHGYWAARVPLNILSITPGIGEPMRLVLLGGSEVTHLTLTRFVSIHVGLLPCLMLVGLTLHWALSWRRIVRDADAGHGEGCYWPHQAWRDSVVLAVYAGLLALWVYWRGGAPLGAPADPAQEYAAARPEWFFLWLFQLLKYFTGGTEIWGAVVLPAGMLMLLALTPCFAAKRLGHHFNRTVVLLVCGGIALLTVLAWREDSRDPVYARAREQAAREARRVRQLASGSEGIPPEGALAMMRRDHRLQGPRLFAQHCASCHRYNGHDGLNREPAEPTTAPDLYGFASQNWLIGLLNPHRVDSHDYFGGTRFASGKMVRFVKRDVAEFDDAQQGQLRKVILAVSAEAALPRQQEFEVANAALIEEGRKLVDDYDLRCSECHVFHEYGEDPSGPLLTGYGSREWMMRFIRDPAHESYYGTRNDRMPRFGAKEILDDTSIRLIVDWLRQEP